MVCAQNFDEQNFDELIVRRLRRKSINREKVGRENFVESLAICQICQSFPPSNFCAIRYVFSEHFYILRSFQAEAVTYLYLRQQK